MDLYILGRYVSSVVADLGKALSIVGQRLVEKGQIQLAGGAVPTIFCCWVDNAVNALGVMEDFSPALGTAVGHNQGGRQGDGGRDDLVEVAEPVGGAFDRVHGRVAVVEDDGVLGGLGRSLKESSMARKGWEITWKALWEVR